MDPEAPLVLIYLISLSIKQPLLNFEILAMTNVDFMFLFFRDKQKQHASISTIYCLKKMNQDVDIKMQNSFIFDDASLENLHCTKSLINAILNVY